MKKMLLLALVAGCSSAPAREQAPSFTLSSLDGKQVRAEDLWSDKPVLLVFMTSW